VNDSLQGRCERCGGRLEARQEGLTEGLFCTKCDWAVVTTHYPEIRLDRTSYEVRAVGGDHRSTEHVKAVANVAGTNFVAARKLLQESRPVVFRGTAKEVVEARSVLKDAGVGCHITPDFEW